MNKKIQDSHIGLLELLLPDYILAYFDLKGVRKEQDVYHLDLEEINTSPLDSNTGKLLSKGFFPSITVQDFPIRGHNVFLHIKRRRWLDQQSGVISRDWPMVATGTRITGKFAAFFKRNQSIRPLL
ncbi:ISAon1 family transposase N-terminal region protein [Niabella aquatica]